MGLPGIQINGNNSGEILQGTRRDDVIAGAGGVDVIFGGMGDDTVNAGAGNDFIYGDLGNDFYFGGSDIDRLIFHVLDGSAEGTSENNYNGVRFDLAVTTAQNTGVYGWDTAFGIENISGGYGNDQFFGDAGINEIAGFVGADWINGRAGNDRLQGGAGTDVLIGGRGADLLGGYELSDIDDGVRDTLKYVSVTDSGITAATRDTIGGFIRGAAATADRIDLSAIDANPFLAGNQAFAFLGTGAFRATRVGEVRIVQSGGNTYIQVDTDRDNGTEMTILVESVSVLTRVDFIL